MKVVIDTENVELQDEEARKFCVKLDRKIDDLKKQIDILKIDLRELKK